MDTKRIDFDALNELKDMLEDEFIELIDTYKVDMTLKTNTLSAEIAVLNHDDIRKLAHSMKGASLNIGIVHFSSLCHQLEEDAKNAVQENYSNFLDLIQQELAAVLTELDAFIA